MLLVVAAMTGFNTSVLTRQRDDLKRLMIAISTSCLLLMSQGCSSHRPKVEAVAINNLTRAFYAMGNTKTPTKVSTLLYTLSIPVKILAFFKFGLIGLAVTMSTYFLANSITQSWLLRKELLRKDSFGEGGALTGDGAAIAHDSH
jgi:hypothetical protein